MTGGAGADPHLANGFAVGTLLTCFGKMKVQSQSAQRFRSRHLLMAVGGCRSRGCQESHENNYPYAAMSHLLKGLDPCSSGGAGSFSPSLKDPRCVALGPRFCISDLLLEVITL